MPFASQNRALKTLKVKDKLVNRIFSTSFTTKSNNGVTLTPRISLPFQSTTATTFKPTLTDGQYRVGPPLQVPSNIARPKYATQTTTFGIPDPLSERSYGEVKSQAAVHKMRAAGSIAAQALQVALDNTKPGTLDHTILSKETQSEVPSIMLLCRRHRFRN